MGKHRKKKEIKEISTSFIRRNNRLRTYTKKFKTPMKNALNLNYDLSESGKQLVEWFIKPLLRNVAVPQSIMGHQEHALVGTDKELEDKLAIIFCVSTRDIVPAIVVEDMKMPGFVVLEDGLQVRPPTTTEAKFKKGCPVFVRIDDVMVDHVEIESCENPGLMFKMPTAMYKTILPKLKELTGCNYRLDPPERK